MSDQLPSIKIKSCSPLRNFAKELLQKILLEEGDLERVKNRLPHLSFIVSDEDPTQVSFQLLSSSRRGLFLFFFEMITHWLQPGKKLTPNLTYAFDFSIPQWGEKSYFFAELVIDFGSESERKLSLEGFSRFAEEISLGIASPFCAQMILEMKGFSEDLQTKQVQRFAFYLSERYPDLFGREFVKRVQRSLLLLPDPFRADRTARHLSRLIIYQYRLEEQLQDSSARVQVKVFPSILRHKGYFRSALSISIAANLKEPKEFLSETEAVELMQKLTEPLEIIPGSIFRFRGQLYFEVKKQSEERFTAEEVARVKREFPHSVEGAIKQLNYPLLMPRNEEEIIRKMVQLNGEVRYVSDPPQLTISFEEQTLNELIYHVVLLRVVKKESLPITELLQRYDQQNTFQLEMTKQMGILRKRYPVEAYLLIASLPKERFVRKSHINLYRARQYLVKEMKEMVGPLRDFNGGMLSREQELLSKIQTYAPFVDETTTEALFYAIDPPIMRTQIDASLAGELFSKIDKLLDDPYSDNGPLFDESLEEGVIAVMTTNSSALQKRVKEVALPLCETSHDLAITSIQRGGRICLGVAFRSPETKQRSLFKESLNGILNK